MRRTVIGLAVAGLAATAVFTFWARIGEEPPSETIGPGQSHVPFKHEAAPHSAVGETASETSTSALPANVPTLSEAGHSSGFKVPLQDLYDRAINGGTIHDKVAAAKSYFACLEVRDMAKMGNEAQAVQEGWGTMLPTEASRKEARKAIDTLAGYCAQYGGPDFLSELKKRGQKIDASYFSLAFTTRPVQERLPHVVAVLSSPSSNALEFTVWAGADLNAILQSRYGLTRVQANYATDIVVSKYIADVGVKEFHATYECAVKLNCGTNLPPTVEERLRAERAASEIQSFLEQQRWQQLIYSKQP